MKPTRLAALTAAGMFLTSVTVYSLTPPGGIAAGGDPSASVTPDPIGAIVASNKAVDPSRFSAGATLMVDGRLGHSGLARGDRGETFVMLEVSGDPAVKASARAPVNLSIVIDRSGSMRGTRIRNAIEAAVTAVSRLEDGDMASVVTFDTRTAVVVPPTAIGIGTRQQAVAAIRGITLGGDTCLSCGIDEGLRLLDETTGRVNRMIVLSDGDANHGIRDIPGFRSLAQRARERGTAVTTVGVDVEYNEKVLSAIAQESNGRHHFVENDAGLARVFEAEAETLIASIASNAEASIELGAGVELDRVFDRTFRRSGNRVLVPLGAFARGETKTILLKVRVPTDRNGVAPVADVELTYRDLAADAEGRCNGRLALEVGEGPGAAAAIDPLVLTRMQRSETAAVLREANELVAKGRQGEARSKLEAQQKNLAAAGASARRAAPAAKAKKIDADFAEQERALGDANSGFASPPPASPGAAPRPAPARQQQTTVRQNAQAASEFGF